jgi:hypothetical protein
MHSFFPALRKLVTLKVSHEKAISLISFFAPLVESTNRFGNLINQIDVLGIAGY